MGFPEKYKPYNDWLIENTNIDWWDLQDKCKKLGNCAGVYPDTLMLLCKIAMLDEVKTIVELGSGSSTVYLEKIAKSLGKTFISFEEKELYHQMTSALCKKYSLYPDLRVFNQWNIPPADMVWVDCCKERRQNFWSNIDKMDSTKWFIQDDSQNPVYAIPMIKGLTSQNKFNLSFYNPIGRADREQLICHTDNNFCVTKWVWSWRPDKVSW